VSADGRLVTPEAVGLDLQTATVATRGLARLLDILLQLIAVLLVTVAVGVVDGGASATVVTTIVLLAVFIIRIVYPVAFETRLGGTLGHLAMGLRVVTADGAPIRARQALTRSAVGLFEIEATFGLVALLVAGSRTDGRRLGDLAAGTLVVSVRVGTGQAEALHLQVPPALAAWVTTIDAAGLAQPERAALRRYLGRAATLPAATRDELAGTLADKLVPRLAAERPPGASAHDVLVAIAASATGGSSRAPASPPVVPPAPPPGDGFRPLS